MKKIFKKPKNKENLSFHYHIIYYIEHHLTITFTCKSAALIVTQIALAVGHLSRRGFKGEMFYDKSVQIKSKRPLGNIAHLRNISIINKRSKIL